MRESRLALLDQAFEAIVRNMLGILVFLVFFAASLFGWGVAFRAIFRLPVGGVPTTVVLGLSFLVFIGGLANLGGIAYSEVLLVLLVCGMGATLFDAFRFVRALPEGSRSFAIRSALSFSRSTAIVFLLIAVAAAFAIVTQLRPSAYNIHDDLQKYFYLPVKMLDTGSVFGSATSAVGSETFGGAAFLHGFLVAWFPIAFINGMDAVLGLLLCLFLVVQLTGESRARNLIGCVLCLLLVVVVDPQYVNVSPLYLAAAAMMGAIGCIAVPDEVRRGEVGSAAAVGVVCACLGALKTSYLLFGSLFIPLVMLSFLCGGLGFKAAFGWAFRASVCFLLFLAPWLLLHAPNFVSALSAQDARTFYLGNLPRMSADMSAFDAFYAAHIEFFSFESTQYGASVSAYTLLGLAGIAVGVLAAMAGSRHENGGRDRFLILFLSLLFPIAFFVFVSRLSLVLSGVETAVRYSTPYAIGVVTGVFALASRAIQAPVDGKPAALRLSIFAAAALVPLAIFSTPFSARVEKTYALKSALSFLHPSYADTYANYVNGVLEGETWRSVAAAQNAVPPGVKMVAWIDAPFLLDFRRNAIQEVDIAGLATGWARISDVSYFVWQYSGYATRKRRDYEAAIVGPGAYDRRVASIALAFAERLGIVGGAGEVLYNDGSIVVFKVQEGALLKEPDSRR